MVSFSVYSCIVVRDSDFRVLFAWQNNVEYTISKRKHLKVTLTQQNNTVSAVLEIILSRHSVWAGDNRLTARSQTNQHRGPAILNSLKILFQDYKCVNRF